MELRAKALRPFTKTLYAINMKFIAAIFLIIQSANAFAEFDLNSSTQECLKYVKIGENYKIAQNNEHCLKAAIAGSGPAQYSVGMGYGFEGNKLAEEAYTLMAAKQGFIAAYLALGYLYKEGKEDEALYWHERFVKTGTCGSGFVAILIADIYKKRGDSTKYTYWKDLSDELKKNIHEICGNNK